MVQRPSAVLVSAKGAERELLTAIFWIEPAGASGGFNLAD